MDVLWTPPMCTHTHTHSPPPIHTKSSISASYFLWLSPLPLIIHLLCRVIPKTFWNNAGTLCLRHSSNPSRVLILTLCASLRYLDYLLPGLFVLAFVFVVLRLEHKTLPTLGKLFTTEPNQQTFLNFASQFCCIHKLTKRIKRGKAAGSRAKNGDTVRQFLRTKW